MRTSRISKDTSKLVLATSAARRSTRLSSQLDLEDAVPPPKKQKRESTPRTPIKRSPARSITVKKEAEGSVAVKEEVEGSAVVKKEFEESIAFPPAPDRKARKPARKIKNEESGEVEIHPPNDWAEVYAAVKEMRLTGPAQNAAVDTMGCSRLAQKDASPKVQRYQTLIALMLSSQTKDTTNAFTMHRLYNELPPYQEGAPGGLNLENILAVEPSLLNELIWAVGFHNNKTKYIKAAAEILRDKWEGDIPDTIEGLVSLPGVGPKMAHLCLSAAWGRTEGIGVDVHVHRITNLWGWHKTKGPEETRLALQAWLPQELWHEINWLLVGFGQTVCQSVARKCGECDLGLKGLCKAADRAKVNIGRKTREEMIIKNEGVLKVENIKEEAIIKNEGVVEIEKIKKAIIKNEGVVEIEKIKKAIIKNEGVVEIENIKKTIIKNEGVLEIENIKKERIVKDKDLIEKIDNLLEDNRNVKEGIKNMTEEWIMNNEGFIEKMENIKEEMENIDERMKNIKEEWTTRRESVPEKIENIKVEEVISDIPVKAETQ